MKVYVENKDKMTAYQWGYDEEIKGYFVKINFNLPSDTKVKVLSLDDYTKQVRKEVINGIRKQVQDQIIICGAKATEQDIIEANSYNSCISDIIDILDKIQGEINGKEIKEN